MDSSLCVHPGIKLLVSRSNTSVVFRFSVRLLFLSHFSPLDVILGQPITDLLYKAGGGGGSLLNLTFLTMKKWNTVHLHRKKNEVES